MIGRDSEALTAMSWHSRSSITGKKNTKNGKLGELTKEQ